VEIQAAIAMAPYDASLRADLAELLANAGRLDTAVEWLHESIRRDPRPLDWYYSNLAWAYYLQGRDELALRALQSRRSDLPNPLFAVVSSRLGQNSEGRAILTDYRRRKLQANVEGELLRPLVPSLMAKWKEDLMAIGLRD
jgi:tetratricopeptide (TPR) repeat protein